ncbi:ABC transporter ATP-binding protein [Paenibacillus sediminis]|uniref:ATP-binding cassette subfamily B protein n=1 Tax=Paenibacillus sediminis TaxID=664909 RepID=A0ABS4H484_9BACL|nr:ABC transporter ATP-binding protein [Paenibacillus sediminis]MBP1937352.1 ATP-binding cassette subfamily B protein [Paenibacillus sediminis]
MNDYQLLKDYVRAHIPYYVLAIALIITSNVDQSALPRVLGQFMDELQQGTITHSSILHYSLLLLFITISYAALFGIGQYTVMRLGRKFEYTTRQQIFYKFTTLSESYYSKQGTGKLLSYVMNDVTSVRESISNGVNQTTNAVFLLISCIVMMLISGIPISLLVISVCPLVIIPFLVVYFGPQIKKRSMKVQEALATMTESAEEQLGGIRVTKTFAMENIAQTRFGQTVDDIRDSQLKLVRMSSLFQALLPFLGSISLVISLLVGGYMTLTHRITLGNFVALTLYLRIIMGPLQQIGNVINMMQRSRASLERVNRLLAEVPDVGDSDDALPLNHIKEIRIEHLNFAYPNTDNNVLRDIHLHIQAGRTIGIVGKTGSGKTTLVKLLLRVYNPASGSIRINGTDILNISLDSLRQSIAYVPQGGFLFSTTIRDNIAFSNREAPMSEVEAAARQAMIYDSIASFPNQFETKLGERGLTLSGGQRQRTSLARGLMKKASLLILDDSMSAVDAVTETNIITRLRQERKGKTTIIISHRISAVRHADEIIVLDQGQIVQRGTHEQLLAAGGIYASLHQIQEEGLQHV